MLASISNHWPADPFHTAISDAPIYAMSDPAGDIGANVSFAHATLVGDPIHAGIGNKSHQQTDYNGDGAYALAFARTYNAQAPEVSAYVRQNIGPDP